jgi:hypothetical protein
MENTVDLSLLKIDSVRSAIALAAFGVTGGLAWFHGDDRSVAIAADRGAAVAPPVARPAPIAQRADAGVAADATTRGAAAHAALTCCDPGLACPACVTGPTIGDVRAEARPTARP